MWILVAYDVSTETAKGRRRLRRVAKICESYGQRVQKSVFECQVDPATWAHMRGRLLAEVHSTEDSLRFYFLGNNADLRVEHHGLNRTWDMEGLLLV